MKRLKELNVMYIEDDDETIEEIRILLEDVINEYIFAKDTYEALELYCKNKPDIVLLDIRLSKDNGLDIAKEIKRIDAHQPIIIISAYDNKEYLIKALDIGVDYFIKKPVNFEKLVEKMISIAKKLEKRNNFKKLLKRDNIYKLAYLDELTQTVNRSYFDRALSQAVKNVDENGLMLGLFFIDIDNFKEINDNFGHHKGDEVLKKVSEIIKKTIRKSDILARIGGDEFAVIVENVKSKELLKHIAERILESTQKSFIIEDKRVNCSIGIGIYPNDCDNEKELLKVADRAMYEAKKSGKGTYRFYSDIYI